ncbi:MAG: hypothetical protein GY819_00620, partial [Planctomycetaceae bacterium]|nr:hypothetical protein [Planctomycetaceae bacterium]
MKLLPNNRVYPQQSANMVLANHRQTSIWICGLAIVGVFWATAAVAQERAKQEVPFPGFPGLEKKASGEWWEIKKRN